MKQGHKRLTPKSEPERTYSVAVVATMSAGKSTLLNAMIGRRLLPARNEACTASVCRIEDRDELPAFRGRSKVAGKWGRWKTPVSSEVLQMWNDTSHDEISIEGNIKTIANTHNGYRVVFIDTPGPNNASCEDHAKITQRVIDEADFSSIVFVVNASVAGVEDEWRLLSRLQQVYSSTQKKSRIIFAVNKIDLLDAEHGESVVDVLKACEAHLRGIGFHNPVVVPLCSDLGLSIRQMRAAKVKYKRGKDKPSPPRGQRKNLYEAVESPRAQARLRRQIETFLAQRTFYRNGISYSAEGAKALSRIEHTRVKSSGRILLGGKFFKESDLRSAEKLSGIPVLEILLQQDLNAFANKKEGVKG